MFSSGKMILLFVLIFAFTETRPMVAQSVGDSIVFAHEDTLFAQQQPEKIGSYFYRVFFVTAIIILLLFSVLFFYKKLGGKALETNRSKIHILARQNLTPKQLLMIVAIEGKKYVLGVSEHSVNLITELGEVSEDELPINDLKQVSQNFTSVLNKLLKK